LFFHNIHGAAVAQITIGRGRQSKESHKVKISNAG